MSSALYSFINSITNNITSRYDVKSQIASAGLWKIYSASRKTTGQQVAIFVSFLPRNVQDMLRSTRIDVQCIAFCGIPWLATLTLLQIFEKRSLESGSRRERGASKADTDRVYEMLKKEVRAVEDG